MTLVSWRIDLDDEVWPYCSRQISLQLLTLLFFFPHLERHGSFFYFEVCVCVSFVFCVCLGLSLPFPLVWTRGTLHRCLLLQFCRHWYCITITIFATQLYFPGQQYCRLGYNFDWPKVVSVGSLRCSLLEGPLLVPDRTSPQRTLSTPSYFWVFLASAITVQLDVSVSSFHISTLNTLHFRLYIPKSSAQGSLCQHGANKYAKLQFIPTNFSWGSGVDAKLVKKLYRNILRTTKNWPYYEDRTNYLQQGLQSTVRTLFRFSRWCLQLLTPVRAHANETDPKKVERLVSYGLLEHGSMKRILSGVYFGQVFAPWRRKPF